MAGEGFSKADFAPYDFAVLDAETLRNVYETLLRKFADAVPPKFQHDSVANLEWRNAMYAALIGEDEKTASEESLLGLSSEFFMQIEWLPGGRIEEGELIFDSVLDLAEETNDAELRRLCDDKCRGFIFNFVREYGDLEYVNIGRVVGSLSYRAKFSGRRDVYIAQVKLHGIAEEIIKIIRMQKWGIREHLNDGKKLLDAIMQVGGVHRVHPRPPAGLPPVGHEPAGPHRRQADQRAVSRAAPRPVQRGDLVAYFERDFIRGMATDKIPPQRLADAAFAARLARLLGQAAAPNMIVGRCDSQGRVVFDDGDEVVVENDGGLPVEIIVADQMGTFADYRSELEHFAAEYAARSTAAFRWSAIRPTLPRSTSTPLSAAFPASSSNTASGSGRSIPCSNIVPATRRAASPIAGNACSTASAAPPRKTSATSSAARLPVRGSDRPSPWSFDDRQPAARPPPERRLRARKRRHQWRFFRIPLDRQECRRRSVRSIENGCLVGAFANCYGLFRE